MSQRTRLGRISRENFGYNLSFAGCGFLCLYHIGVISCIRRFAPHLYINRPVSGASAGAFVGAFLICDVDTLAITEIAMKVINASRAYRLGALDPRFKSIEYFREGLERLLPPDAHIRCSGRLFISMTHLNSRENCVVSNFKTREDLIRAMLCSSFIPVFGGFIAPVYEGDYFIDGAFSDNLPIMNRNTITVSPFCGDADICPRNDIYEANDQATAAGHIYVSQTSLMVNWTNVKRFVNIIIPMHCKDLGKLACSGYEDALRFLLLRGMIACPVHRGLRSFDGHDRRSRCAEDLEVVPKQRCFTQKMNLEPLVRRKLLSLSSPSSESASCTPKVLLWKLINPLDDSLFQTTLGSRSLAVPSCIACRIVMLNSYSSELPAKLYSLISGETDELLGNGSKDNQQKKETSPWWSFSSFSMSDLPQWLYPSSVAHQALAQVRRLLALSTSLQVSVARSVISVCLGLVKQYPSSTVTIQEPVEDFMIPSDATLKTLDGKGTTRTDKLVVLPRSNEGLDKGAFSMIRSSLLAFLTQFKSATKAPLLNHSHSEWIMQEPAHLPDQTAVDVDGRWLCGMK